MLSLFFERIVIGNRGAALDRAGNLNRAARMQQGFEQRGLARGGMPDERDVSDAFGGVCHDGLLCAKKKRMLPFSFWQQAPRRGGREKNWEGK